MHTSNGKQLCEKCRRKTTCWKSPWCVILGYSQFRPFNVTNRSYRCGIHKCLYQGLCRLHPLEWIQINRFKWNISTAKFAKCPFNFRLRAFFALIGPNEIGIFSLKSPLWCLSQVFRDNILCAHFTHWFLIFNSNCVCFFYIILSNNLQNMINKHLALPNWLLSMESLEYTHKNHQSIKLDYLG